MRLPDDEDVRALVRACGGALTATSANVSGQPPARTAEDVRKYFPTGVDLIVDGGEVTATQASTVLDLSGTTPRLISEGAIARDELDEFRRSPLKIERKVRDENAKRAKKLHLAFIRGSRLRTLRLNAVSKDRQECLSYWPTVRFRTNPQSPLASTLILPTVLRAITIFA